MALWPRTSRAKLRAQRKWCKSMQDQGFSQVSLWVPCRYVDRVKLFAEMLREGRTARKACSVVFQPPKAKK
jgi:hypothetical protein